MLFSDAKSQWDPDLLSDARVTHYWDPDLSIGRWFDANEDQIGFEFNKGPIVWDSYFLFGPEAMWASTPSPLISYGNTILAEREELLEATQAILDS